MASRRQGLVVFGTGALVALFSGCSPLDQGAVTLDDESRRPMLVLNLCEGEGIKAVRLTEARVGDDGLYEEGRTLWRIEAAEPRTIETVVAGEVPQGFREVVALSTTLPDDLVMLAENAGDGGVAAEQGGGYFKLRELRPGVLLQDGSERSAAGLRSDADRNCNPSLFGMLGLPAWLDWIVAIGVGASIVTGVVLGFRSRSRYLRRVNASHGTP